MRKGLICDALTSLPRVWCGVARPPLDLQCLTCMQLLQEEFESYRSTAEAVAESKDAELAKALKGNAQLRSQLTELQSSTKEVCAPFPFHFYDHVMQDLTQSMFAAACFRSCVHAAAADTAQAGVKAI